MREIHGDGAFADRRGDALDRSVTHIAGNKDARHARLEQVRLSRHLPGGGQLAFLAQIGSGEQVAGVVTQNSGRQPLGGGLGADKNKERGSGYAILALRPAKQQGLKALVAKGLHHLGLAPQFDIWSVRDLIDQVL